MRHYSAALLLLVLWLLLSPRMGAALVSPASPDAFEIASYALDGGVVSYSSPAIADVTGDGVPEVLVGTTAFNGQSFTYNRPTRLVVLRGDGSLVWSKDVEASVTSAPAVGDLNGDGLADVVVTTNGDGAHANRNGAIIAYDRNGNRLWRWATRDITGDGFTEGISASPLLCDLDGDGKDEVFVGAWDQRYYLLSGTGASLWNNRPGNAQGPGYLNADSIGSTAACVDFNQDGSMEIVVGSDASPGTLPDGTASAAGGYVYVFDRLGNVLVRRFIPETVQSSPAVGDLNGDGTYEIVVGTGGFWWNQGGRVAPTQVYAFSTAELFGPRSYTDPAKLPNLAGWPQTTVYPSSSSPALADLDGNGDLEIVIGAGHPDINTGDGIPGAGRVYAWHHTGQPLAGWPVTPRNGANQDASITSSPIVADVDADGQLEILFSMIWDVHVYNVNGSFQERLATRWTTWASPAVGDTDGDGHVDVWIGSGKDAATGGDQSRGYLWRFRQTANGTGPQPWPQFHRDAQHTGLLALPASLSANSVYAFDRPGGSTTVRVSLPLSNTGGSPVEWEVSGSPGAVTVAPTSGTLGGGDETMLTLTITTAGLSQGTHLLGNITFTGTDLMANSPITPLEVPVSVYVGDYSSLYIPTIRR